MAQLNWGVHCPPLSWVAFMPHSLTHAPCKPKCLAYGSRVRVPWNRRRNRSLLGTGQWPFHCGCCASTGAPQHLLHQPCPQSPKSLVPHHQKSEKWKAMLGGLANCRLVINEGKTFWNNLNQRFLKIRKTHQKMEKMPPSWLIKPNLCSSAQWAVTGGPAHPYPCTVWWPVLWTTHRFF